MRSPIVRGLFALSLLAVVTCVATSTFITPLIVKATQPSRQAGKARHVPRVTLSEQRPPLPPGSRRIPKSKWASYGMTQSPVTRSVRLISAETDGTLVHLKADAVLVDPRPGVRYVWWVRLFKGNKRKNLFFDRLYDHQAFAVPAEGMNPTFEDIIDLPVAPGSYVVDIGLLTFDGSRNLATEREKKLKNGDLAYGAAKIVIRN